MKYESLIFDIDGTLWNSLDLVAEGYNIQMRREGYDRYCTTGDVLFKFDTDTLFVSKIDFDRYSFSDSTQRSNRG